jgi:hypothetical protein
MVRLITRVWSEFWVRALMNDAQLMRLVGLQPHHLIQLAERAPESLTNNNGRRMWRLSLCLRHVRGLK